MRVKKTWARPAVRRLDADDPTVTPEQRDAIKDLRESGKQRKPAPA